MTCHRLGGVCNKEFHANIFDEIAEKSKEHGRECLSKEDEKHLAAMNEMQELMKSPTAMKEWFDKLPEK